MNFFESQQQARTQSRRLLFLFGLAVLAIVAAVDIVLVTVMSKMGSEEQAVSFTHMLRTHSGALLGGAIVTVALIALASIFKIATLRSGGSAVAQSLGGTLLASDKNNPHYRRLRNVVEEIAIASGVPVPQIYVLEQEMGINAFAAGYSPSDAAVAVTRGALDKLTRDELQAVIAHEFSHLLNGDMRLNIQLMGVLFGILALTIIGRKLLQGMRHVRDSKGTGPVFLVAIALVIIGYVGVFFGRAIKASVSRQREYLADASAVQFTRQTAGIAGALKKIGGLEKGSKLSTAEVEEVSHMLFGDGLGYSLLFATHPPLIERIKRLDPQFDPSQYREIAKKWSGPIDVLALDAEIAETGAAALVSGAISLASGGLPKRSELIAISAQQISAQVGNPVAEDYLAADAIRREIPERLRIAADDPASAMAVIYALLLDSNEDLAIRQLRIIAEHAGPAAMAATEHWFMDTANLHPMSRLPLAAMTFPAIRRLPKADLNAFMPLLEQLIHADSKMGVFEYCLAKLINTQVREVLNPKQSAAIGKQKLAYCKSSVAITFSILANFGHHQEINARRAFAAGMNTLYQHQGPQYAVPENWMMALDRALPELDQLDAAGKQLLIEAMVQIIANDSLITVDEATLLHAMCAALHCPLPPLLSSASFAT